MLGIERVKDEDWDIPKKAQLRFKIAGKTFTAGYDHKAGPEGGIIIFEVLPGRGSPRGQVVATITSLEDAAAFYEKPQSRFKQN